MLYCTTMTNGFEDLRVDESGWLTKKACCFVLAIEWINCLRNRGTLYHAVSLPSIGTCINIVPDTIHPLREQAMNGRLRLTGKYYWYSHSAGVFIQH